MAQTSQEHGRLEMTPDLAKVPVTIISGFLGAGKTTFLNYVLTAEHGKKIAVIQNEFGDEIGIERAYVLGPDGKRAQDWVDLPNGCVCCSVKDDLLMTVEKLVQRKTPKIEYIFVECTGLADPGSLSSVFWVDEELESPVYLDGIVTVVDAKHITQQLDEDRPSDISSNNNNTKTPVIAHQPDEPEDINEAERQLAFADRIILNKRDLVTEPELKALVDRIRDINRFAPITIAERSKVPLDEVLSIHAFDSKRAMAVEAQLHGDHHGEHHHDHGRHGTSVTTISITGEGEVDLHAFNSWLGELLWEQQAPLKILRCKGVIAVHGEKQKHMLQGVRTLFEVQPVDGASWAEGEQRLNKIVLIGKGLDKAVLQQSFRSKCLAVT